MKQRIIHSIIWWTAIGAFWWLWVGIYHLIPILIPTSYIWGYDYISPAQAWYVIWDSISFNTSRYSHFDVDIQYDEFIYCVENDRSFLITDSIITDWSFRKWDVVWSFTLWGETNPIILEKTWENCRLQSCQNVLFMWEVKKKCFTSNPTFDILWE